jgi:hypothetical protein
MKGMQHVRGGEDLRSLHVARVRSTLSLNRQQHYLDAHFLALKTSRLESMRDELDRRRDRVDRQLKETREALEHLLVDERAASSARASSNRTMRIDY